MEEDNLFVIKEALHYLIEDCELSCIELETKLNRFQKVYNFSKNFNGYNGCVEPSILFYHINSDLLNKHLIEMEFIREKTNLNYLKLKAEAICLK